MSKALAALARTADPSLLPDLGRWFSSGLAVPVVVSPSLADLLGMNLSPALWGMRTVVLPDLVRAETSFRARSLDDGDCPEEGPVPVKDQSETPSSRCLGDLRVLAMFDLGDSR